MVDQGDSHAGHRRAPAAIKDAQKRWLTDDGISNITLLWATNNVPFYTHVKNYFQPGPTFYGNWSFRHVWLER